MTTTENFRHVTKAGLDSRKRIALGKVATHEQYDIRVNDDGEILLIPLVSIPAREMIIWENSKVRADLEAAKQDIAAGRVVDGGDFTQYIND